VPLAEPQVPADPVTSKAPLPPAAVDGLLRTPRSAANSSTDRSRFEPPAGVARRVAWYRTDARSPAATRSSSRRDPGRRPTAPYCSSVGSRTLYGPIGRTGWPAAQDRRNPAPTPPTMSSRQQRPSTQQPGWAPHPGPRATRWPGWPAAGLTLSGPHGAHGRGRHPIPGDIPEPPPAVVVSDDAGAQTERRYHRPLA
jgi:hypothetical protein